MNWKRTSCTRILCFSFALTLLLAAFGFPPIVARATSDNKTVGTDTNDAIRTALLQALNGETVTLQGRGTVTLNTSDVIMANVSIVPDAGQQITLINGNYQGTMLFGGAAGTRTTVDSATISLAAQSAGTTQLRRSRVANDSFTPYVIRGGSLEMVNSTIASTTGTALQIDDNVESILVYAGSSIKSGSAGAAINTDGAAVAKAVNAINIYGSVISTGSFAIYVRPQMTVQQLNVYSGGQVSSTNNGGSGIENRGAIQTLAVKAGGVVSGGMAGLYNEGLIASLSNQGSLRGFSSILQYPANDLATANITAIDLNSGFLWGNTALCHAGGITLTSEEMPVLSVPAASYENGTWTWTALATNHAGTENVSGMKLCVYDETTGSIVCADTTDANGRVSLAFHPTRGDTYKLRSYGYLDIVKSRLYASQEFQPQFAGSTAVTGMTASTTALSGSGGTVTFTVTGSYLWSSSSLAVRSDVGGLNCAIDPITSDTANAVTVTLPSNTTGSTVIYTFRPWLNGAAKGFPVQVTVPSLAAVQTGTVTDVSSAGVTLHGTVTSEGSLAVSERGFVYGAAATPTLQNAAKAPCGSGSGSFSAALAGLPANTTYHVRAYAVSGAGTVYGEDQVFSTKAIVTVGFDSRGGSPVPAGSVASGSKLAQPQNPTRTGFDFTGWFRDAACSVPWRFAEDAATGDMTLFAGWTAQTQNAALRGITLSAGALTRAFRPTVKSYTVLLGENESTVTLTPVRTYDLAGLKINNRSAVSKTVTLANGKQTTLTVKVTLGKKSTTYRVTVRRAKSTVNTLAALSASAGVWSQGFDPSVTAYTLTLPGNVSKVKLSAARASALSKLSPSKASCTVKNGRTVKVTFRVTAQSGAKKTYTVMITRQ